MGKVRTVAMLVSEMVPFAKTGGLADVAGALPKALGERGVQVHLFLPRYACVKETKPFVDLANRVRVHFIDHPAFFGRPALYGESGDYLDNLQRFGFFCREALARMLREGIVPDILHAHDWQAALGVVYLRRMKEREAAFSRTRSVFTIHNLAYQGLFPKDQFPQLELPWEDFTMDRLEFYDRINLLKGGLVFADHLTTVSPTYAQEIQTAAFGEGLEGVLRKRSPHLTGILNGIDEQLWNPATDPHLAARFSASHAAGKAKNKEALQKEVGLPLGTQAMLVGMVTRLASQKGLDLLVEALRELPWKNLQLVLLGRGDKSVEESLLQAAERFPQLKVQLAFDDGLAHRIYAGTDAFLMPSRYEPCGLGQMIAMRYGSVPIVRAIGGLADTVFEDETSGNGFRFTQYTKEALMETLNRALSVYRDRKAAWQAIQKRGISTDFSWGRSAGEYLELYEKLLS